MEIKGEKIVNQWDDCKTSGAEPDACLSIVHEVRCEPKFLKQLSHSVPAWRTN